MNQKAKLPGPAQARVRELGVLIAAARRARRLTQTDLASRAGTSRATINRIENGGAAVAWGTVATVCWLLDVSSDPESVDPVRRAALLAGTADVARVRSPREVGDDF